MKQEPLPGFRTIFLNAESNPISKSSSSSDLALTDHPDHINLPLKQDSPKKMLFLKVSKHSGNIKYLTEPSPERLPMAQERESTCAIDPPSFFSAKNTP